MGMIGKGAEATPERPTLSGPEQAKFLQRVARAAEVAQHRGGLIRLRLSPPELGTLRLEVRVETGVLTARIEVEVETARTALMQNLGALRERLAEQGIRVEKFDVGLMDQQTGSQPDSPSDRHASAPHSINQSQPARPEDELPELPSSADALVSMGLGNLEQLNVVI